MAIKLYNGTEMRLGEILRNRWYINDRQPKKGIFFDNSKCKIGNKALLTDYISSQMLISNGLDHLVKTTSDKI